jgi:uncharacterized protein
MREDWHPSEVVRHARRVVAAVDFAREPDRDVLAERLVLKGICRTLESAHASVEALEERLHPKARAWNNLYLHVTFSCQLQCTHCYAVAGGGREAMALPAVLQLLAETQAVGFRQLVVTGGEPLMHSERQALLSGLREAREKRLCATSTNLVLRTNFALRLTDEEITTIGRAFDQIVVSVDGAREVHDARRGAGSYDATLANIERFQALPIPSRGELSLSTVLPNAQRDGDQETSVRRLAQRLGIHRTRFRPLLPLGRAAAWEAPPTLDACGPRWSPMREIERGFWPSSTCGLGENLYVDPAGEAFPCYAVCGPHARLGNVLEEGLAAVLASEGCRDLGRHTVDTNVKCRGCDVRYLCGGACKAWSRELSSRDLDAPPEDCSSLRVRAERLVRAAEDYLGASKHSNPSAIDVRRDG